VGRKSGSVTGRPAVVTRLVQLPDLISITPTLAVFPGVSYSLYSRERREMTKHARLVLSDAKDAIAELPPEGTYPGPAMDEATIRRRWVAAIALLRAVGNVLKDVDSNQGVFMAEAIKRKWGEPKPEIFTAFIEQYRSAMLKRYELPQLDYDVDMGKLYPRLGVHINGAGPICADHVMGEAIAYWEDYLDDVDRLAAQLSC